MEDMCYIGSLLGYTYIHEMMLDKEIEIYIEQLMNVEVTPTLSPVPGINLDQYKRTLIERFSNAHIKVNASRICMISAAKFPIFFCSDYCRTIKTRK